MGANKTNQKLEYRLTNAVKAMRTEQGAIKTRQLLGGDNIVVGQSTEAGGTIVLPNGLHVNVAVELQSYGNVSNLLPICYFDLYIGDGHDLDVNYLWPSGNLLTNEQKRGFTMSWRFSIYRSDVENGSHVLPVFIYNQTLVTETLYFHARFRYPEIAIA
jgi:hypothetical protein